jgi:hypothetical protein
MNDKTDLSCPFTEYLRLSTFSSVLGGLLTAEKLVKVARLWKFCSAWFNADLRLPHPLYPVWPM